MTPDRPRPEARGGPSDRPASGTDGADLASRRRAALAALPLLALGLAIVAFGVVASPRPLFGFLIFPPVVFLSVLTYLAVRHRMGLRR